jgi:hypothetical protein
MPLDNRLTSVLCGISGEYLVASNADATKSVGIQVKTSQGRNPEWLLSAKVERDSAKNLFYVFVRLNGLATPEFFIVPREVVATFVRVSHARWLRTLGRRGTRHRDNPLRKFRDPEGRYRDRWDLLGLGRSAV